MSNQQARHGARASARPKGPPPNPMHLPHCKRCKPGRCCPGCEKCDPWGAAEVCPHGFDQHDDCEKCDATADT